MVQFLYSFLSLLPVVALYFWMCAMYIKKKEIFDIFMGLPVYSISTVFFDTIRTACIGQVALHWFFVDL